MSFTVPRRPHTSQGTGRREITPFNFSASSKFLPLPTLPQSPVTQTAFGIDEHVSCDTAATDEHDRTVVSAQICFIRPIPHLIDIKSRSQMQTPHPSTSRSPSVMARMFSPRKKATSLSSVDSGSASGHGHLIASTVPRKKAISIASITSNETEDPLIASSPTNSSTNLSMRKGFEPVGHIAQTNKPLWRIRPQSPPDNTRRPYTSSSVSASSLSLSLEQRSRVPRRSASASETGTGGGWWPFGRKRRDSELDQTIEDAEASGSGEDTDEIRRPSDLGPASEVMDISPAYEKPLPEIPIDELSPVSPLHRDQPDRELTDVALISRILGYLPTSIVARHALVSHLWLDAARVVIYGCIDLRLNLDRGSESKDGSATAGVDLQSERRRLRRQLQLMVETLGVRNGQLFEGTWGLLMDEWPFGWELNEVEVDVDVEDTQTDAASVRTEYTAYTESDFSSDATSVMLEVPSSPVYRLSNSPIKSTFAASQDIQVPNNARASPQALLTNLIASLPSLTTLCLPSFHLPILKHHVAFGLRKVEFLREIDLEEMLKWLDGMVGVVDVRIGSRAIEAPAVDQLDKGRPSGKHEPQDENDSHKLWSTNTKRRKRKTFLIISTRSSSSSGSTTPLASATFPGTSFPMPPTTPLSEKRSSALSSGSDSASIDRPTSLLTPPGLQLPPSVYPSPLQTVFRPVSKSPDVNTPSPPLDPLSPTSSGSQSPTASAYHTPTLVPSSPVTSSTPSSPVDPITPLTPCTPFYLQSSPACSPPSTPRGHSDNDMAIEELCVKTTLLPSLRVFHGPLHLVKLVVPPRRKTLQEVRIVIRGTVLDGTVKTGDVTRGLEMDGQSALEDVGLYFAEDTDRRTVEKILGAVGVAAFPSEVEGDEKMQKGATTLEVVLAPRFRVHPNQQKSNEIMYKTVHSMLPRYNGLEALVLRRDAPLDAVDAERDAHDETIQERLVEDTNAVGASVAAKPDTPSDPKTNDNYIKPRFITYELANRTCDFLGEAENTGSKGDEKAIRECNSKTSAGSSDAKGVIFTIRSAYITSHKFAKSIDALPTVR
ncbi:hypothetical protein VNI00_006430 [Paramarasmius palmivorus]|uniref:Uncharacterized protein n=1 Tax=Paramarasmius palmivorus TaxID=297713 RepID=A0AAW0D7G2_9AGAR